MLAQNGFLQYKVIQAQEVLQSARVLTLKKSEKVEVGLVYTESIRFLPLQTHEAEMA